MALNWRKFTASGLLVTAGILCLKSELVAAERVVILTPAATDVLEQLGVKDRVVGVTNSVDDFPDAVRVGTHLHPGVEKIALLKPDLIIAASWFNPELAERMGADLFVYDPKTLDEIIHNIRLLSGKLQREEQGRVLAEQLQAVLDALVIPDQRPMVLYETRSAPLAIARENSIITDLLKRAGLRYAYQESTGLLSVEYLMAHPPEYYLYQEGPMNKDPVPPVERPGWEDFPACTWKVDEFAFARPNTEIFETVRLLNSVIRSGQTCARGEAVFSQ